MKHLVFILALSIFFLGNVSTVNAQEIEGRGLRNLFRANQEERIEQREVQRTERRETRQAIRKELRDARTERHAQRLRMRFSKYAEQLSTFLARVEQVVAQREANGGDTTQARSLLAQARTELSTAISKGESAVTQFESISATEYSTQREIALAAAETAQEARAGFQKVRELILQALTSIKDQE